MDGPGLHGEKHRDEGPWVKRMDEWAVLGPCSSGQVFLFYCLGQGLRFKWWALPCIPLFVLCSL